MVRWPIKNHYEDQSSRHYKRSSAQIIPHLPIRFSMLNAEILDDIWWLFPGGLYAAIL